MEKISGIYKIENNVNHHMYIGKAKDIYHRWVKHKSDARRKKDNCPIHIAIRTYGENNFTFSIIEIIEEKDYSKIANEREKYWIKFFNTYENSNHYNLTPGGDGGKGHKLTKQQKENISNGLKTFYQTKKGKEKAKQQSDFMKKQGGCNYKPHTKEWKQQHSEHMKGCNNPNYNKHSNGKRCKCIETNIIYESTRQAEEKTGINHTGISAACRGVQKTAGGYHWQYI